MQAAKAGPRPAKAPEMGGAGPPGTGAGSFRSGLGDGEGGGWDRT